MFALDDMLFIYLPKILLAIFCGSLIGLERELKEKPAGIKTYMLICTGAALFTIISVEFSGLTQLPNEPSRVAAQIVTGIGFLGAGTIILARGHVRGLTSAAAIWMSAAIGMAIGIDLFLFAVTVTLVTIVSLVALGYIEERLGLKGRKTYYINVDISNPQAVSKMITLIDGSRGHCRVEEMEKTPDLTIMRLKCNLSSQEMTKFQKAMIKLDERISFKVD